MYDQIARYYDLTHAELTADIEFVLSLAGRARGPILELGCGTGRLLLPLARAGFNVTGVDKSAAMLARARKRLAAEADVVRARVNLIEAGMSDLELAGEDDRYGLAIIPFNTFMEMDPEQMRGALARIGRYLQPEGRLFIDVANPVAVAQTPNDGMLTLEDTVVDPETGDLVLRLARNWLDDAGQILHITWIYDATPVEGGPVHRTVIEAQYHYLYPHQLQLLLQDAGFSVESLSGGYGPIPFTEESDRLLVVAKCVTG
jgi:SAM-dependent methyltransferase